MLTPMYIAAPCRADLTGPIEPSKLGFGISFLGSTKGESEPGRPPDLPPLRRCEAGKRKIRTNSGTNRPD